MFKGINTFPINVEIEVSGNKLWIAPLSILDLSEIEKLSKGDTDTDQSRTWLHSIAKSFSKIEEYKNEDLSIDNLASTFSINDIIAIYQEIASITYGIDIKNVVVPETAPVKTEEEKKESWR